MKNIEKSIMRNVFVLETKKAVLDFFPKIFILIALLFAINSVISSIIFELQSQGTLDLLDILREDSEIIRRYWGEIFDTITFELPKFETGILIVFICFFMLFIFILLRHWTKINNKCKSLYRYWFNPPSRKSPIIRSWGAERFPLPTSLKLRGTGRQDFNSDEAKVKNPRPSGRRSFKNS